VDGGGGEGAVALIELQLWQFANLPRTGDESILISGAVGKMFCQRCQKEKWQKKKERKCNG